MRRPTHVGVRGGAGRPSPLSTTILDRRMAVDLEGVLHDRALGISLPDRDQQVGPP